MLEPLPLASPAPDRLEFAASEISLAATYYENRRPIILHNDQRGVLDGYYEMKESRILIRKRHILLVEDDSARSKQRRIPGLQRNCGDSAVMVRVHKIVNGEWERVAGKTHLSKSLKGTPIREAKAKAALKLLRTISRQEHNGTIIVAGPAYGGSALFVSNLLTRGLDFVVEVRPSDCFNYTEAGKGYKPGIRRASELLAKAKWIDTAVLLPNGSSSIRYSVADITEVRLPGTKTGRLFVAQTGGIKGLHRGTIIGMTSVRAAPLDDLLRYIVWARWIRPFVRRQERISQRPPSLSCRDSAGKRGYGATLRFRSNITLAKLQDQSSGTSDLTCIGDGPKGVQFSGAKILNLVELFAGAGGMGLGFLMAEHPQRRFRLVFAGELHPIYVQTLKSNHHFLATRQNGWVPESIQPVNLNTRTTFKLVLSKIRESGGIDVLIGGPPCQGFSNANRNSWSSNNPQNGTVNIFMRYVEKLKPRVFLMENVQGIVWTARDGRANIQPSVADHILKRMKSAGYMVFPKLLDAVWYGVPQFRTRFFVLGIHRDAGYHPDNFGKWGPFPSPTHGPAANRPLITVRDAICDLPAIENGHRLDQIDYREADESNWFIKLMRNDSPKESILDHVTSRHANYVIARYKRIPAGGNWQNIAAMMSNYSQVQRTHSNIYRRLEWDEPSITIGHYRKSMLVHPDQHRGLSLREACRLQSFPDWFRFEGTEDGRPGGLVHKQQQLANAVCPLFSKAIAEYILEL